MENINIRFRKLRKACKKTQTEMGKVLGISVSGVSEIEAERRKVTEQHIIMLSNWKERNVNIDWLRTGQGEMFKPAENRFAALLSEIDDSDDKFIRSFIEVYMELDEPGKQVLRNLGKKMAEKYNN